MRFAPHDVGNSRPPSLTDRGLWQIVQINTLALNHLHRSSESYLVRVHLTGSKAVLGSLVRPIRGVTPREVHA